MQLLNKMQSVRGYREDSQVVVEAGKRQAYEQVKKRERNAYHESCQEWEQSSTNEGVREGGLGAEI